MAYSFNTTLLSAEKYSSPAQIGTALSGSGVNIISLSTNDVGISFDSVSPLNGVLFEITIEGSLFSIDTAYQGSQVALVKVPINNVKSYTLYTLNSALSVAPTGNLTTGVTEVVDDEGRRKWLYGYI